MMKAGGGWRAADRKGGRKGGRKGREEGREEIKINILSILSFYQAVP